MGTIPNEWQVASFSEVFRISAGGDVNPALSSVESDQIHCYPIFSNSVSKQGLYGFCSYADHPAASITITARGTLGVATYRDQEYTAIGRVLVLESRQKIVGQFVAKYINSCVSFAIESTGVPQLTAPQIGGYLLALPPYSEQLAIAGVLTDVDTLLEALDQLITKKRDLKQAVMQQLLSGKTRLPGFTVEWEEKPLRDFLVYERPDRYIVDTPTYTDHGEIPVLTANKAFILGYSTETSGVCTDLPVIVFDDFTTNSKFATVPFKLKSSAIKLLKPRNERVSLRYLFERLQLVHFPVKEHKRHYISEYQKILLAIPPFDEQLAIVSVLADMDAEIEALEARLAKTLDLREGMLQELLTGKTRLLKANAING